MDFAALRSLVLLFSLLLVPPPGWCCLVAHPHDADEQTSSCCGCPHCTTPDAQTTGPKPLPAKSSPCPCLDRQTTRPQSPQPVADAVVAVTPLVAVAPAPVVVGSPAWERIAVRFADTLLYLTHCAWLC